MRVCASLRVMLASGILTLARPSFAQPPREGDPPGDPPASAPDNYLPTGPGTTWQAAVSAALAMPAVQLAMTQFSAHGYLREASRDTAAIVADSTIAIIGYSKPGLDMMEGMPIISAITKLKDGHPMTREVVS